MKNHPPSLSSRTSPTETAQVEKAVAKAKAAKDAADAAWRELQQATFTAEPEGAAAARAVVLFFVISGTLLVNFGNILQLLHFFLQN